MRESISTEPGFFGPLLLQVGTTLLQAGASSNRISITVGNIASAYHYIPHINIGPKYISLSLQSNDGKELFNGTRSTAVYGINFRILSGISEMTSRLLKNQQPGEEIENEISRIRQLPHYPRIIVLLVVALAGASFCFTFGGDAAEMSICFGATFFGLWTKQELLKRSFNTYLCTFLSAVVAALFTGAFYKAGVGIKLENAYSTCVLFLIPGVPLINFFIDLFAGNILFGLDRGVNAMLHVMAIAFALAAVIIIYQFPI